MVEWVSYVSPYSRPIKRFLDYYLCYPIFVFGNKKETSQKEIQKENWKEGEFSLLSSFLFFYIFSFLIFFTFFHLITLNIVPTYILLLENIICTICSYINYIKNLGYMIRWKEEDGYMMYLELAKARSNTSFRLLTASRFLSFSFLLLHFKFLSSLSIQYALIRYIRTQPSQRFPKGGVSRSRFSSAQYGSLII